MTTWIQTEQGHALDLVAPAWRMIDFDEMANALARLARFTGHIGAGPYSIAQHCVVGADIVFRDTGSRIAAACFLLHDGEEYGLGDEATPKALAEIAIAGEMFGFAAAEMVRVVKREIKRRMACAVYHAAGLGLEDTGCPPEWRTLVHDYDLRMLATERAHLLGRAPKPWAPAVEAARPLRLSAPLTVWPWPKAADEFRERLRRYLPHRFGAAVPCPKPKTGPARAARRIPVEA